MQLITAVELIKEGVDTSIPGQIWADLGAGSGLFSQALATLLEKTSTVYAIDKDRTVLQSIPGVANGATILVQEKNFVRDSLEFPNALTGILMANSLHYVRDKRKLITDLKRTLAPGGRFIFIEYERSIPNPWVPYPVRFEKLETLMRSCGFSSCTKLGEHPSAFGNGIIYSACAV